jgi:hypothetical protein
VTQRKIMGDRRVKSSWIAGSQRRVETAASEGDEVKRWNNQRDSQQLTLIPVQCEVMMRCARRLPRRSFHWLIFLGHQTFSLHRNVRGSLRQSLPDRRVLLNASRYSCPDEYGAKIPCRPGRRRTGDFQSRASAHLRGVPSGLASEVTRRQRQKSCLIRPCHRTR